MARRFRLRNPGPWLSFANDPRWFSLRGRQKLAAESAPDAEYIAENPPAPEAVWAEEEARYRQRLARPPETDGGSAPD